MKIIIYDPNTDEWSAFINSLVCKGAKRDKVIKEHIIEIGQEIIASEFVKNSHLYTSWSRNLCYEFIGEPSNPLEKIIKLVYSGHNYINMKRNFSEDFTESRTNWDDMTNYADEMAYFIEDIMEDMANANTF